MGLGRPAPMGCPASPPVCVWHSGVMTQPPFSGARRARIVGTAGAGAVTVAALTYIGLADPHGPGFLFPACPFKLITGWNCPFCGGLRMTHDLLHGDVAAAIVDNVFALVGLPALMVWMLVRWLISLTMALTVLALWRTR